MKKIPSDHRNNSKNASKQASKEAAISCHEARSLLPAYIAKEVVGRQQTQLKKHLQDCQDCRNALAELKKPVSSSKDSSRVEFSQYFSEHETAAVGSFESPQPKTVYNSSETVIKEEPPHRSQDLPKQTSVRAGKSRRSLVAFALILITGLAVFFVFFPNPSGKSKPTLEFRLRSENPIEAQKVILELVELLDGTFALTAEENAMRVRIPMSAQDFFFEKLRALGALESVPASGQSSGDPLDDKPGDSSMATLKLAIVSSFPIPEQK